MQPTISEALNDARARLPGETADLDAQVLLARALARDRAWLLAHGDERLTDSQIAKFESDVARVSAGEPLPYVLGHWEFFGLDFEVTPDVLIPRPETELLVEKALDWMRRNPPPKGGARVADVGTGSGCIAVTLAFFRPSIGVVATDISQGALAVAGRNAERHDVAPRIQFRHGNLLEPVDGELDVLCANLPYIPTDTLLTLPVSRTEPRAALDGGPDGLRWIRELLAQSPAKMASGGLVLLEIEAGLGPATVTLARSAFPDGAVELHHDLAGKDRLISIEV